MNKTREIESTEKLLIYAIDHISHGNHRERGQVEMVVHSIGRMNLNQWAEGIDEYRQMRWGKERVWCSYSGLTEAEG